MCWCRLVGFINMKKVEAEAKVKRRRRDLHNIILATIAVAGILTVAAVAPNAMRLLKTTGIDARLRYKTKRVLGRLKQKGEIEFVEKDGKTLVRLTERGEQALALHAERLRLAGERPKKWDQRYRLVMFDVPEKRKRTRDLLRREMREVGFLRIQDSAWLYPYDCEEFVALLKADLHIGKDVLYAVIESIENDAWIRKHFNLRTD